MNRLAVVLAADSATTVQYWNGGGEKEERYFKGANKIFQLSDFDPVGVMIFDSADILRVPWEIVIKSFRKRLGKKTFNDVASYADEFFNFIQTEQNMFPPEIQREAFVNAARGAVLQTIFECTSKDATPEKQMSDIHAAVSTRRTELDATDVLACIGQEHTDTVLASARDDLSKSILEWLVALGFAYSGDGEELVQLGIHEVLKDPKEHMSTAGLVFAGFGDRDVFPTMIEYTSCGLIEGHHIHMVGTQMAIDHETPAWLSAFAQTSMSDTFAAGVSLDIYGSLMEAVREGLSKLADDIGAAASIEISALEGITDLMDGARKSIGKAVLDRARNEHAIPMRRVLGALPVDELAELAETLINLQSLKEKVTKPSETVGGPVDVAVITRNEGLVWVKRKHFFDPSLNSRYMQRQMSIHK